MWFYGALASRLRRRLVAAGPMLYGDRSNPATEVQALNKLLDQFTSAHSAS
jgi:hypothetical protein